MADILEKPKEFIDLETLYKQKRVLLKGDHPHAGKCGVVRSTEFAHAIRKWGFIVDLDDGDSCFVFHPKEWSILHI